MFTDFDLEILGEKWLQAKTERMENLLKIAEPDEAIYREIMLSLGYPNNKLQFLELAYLLPFKEIRKLNNKEVVENALLYRAGLGDTTDKLPQNFDISLRMDKSLWSYKQTRPSNFPEKRLIGITNLLIETSKLGLIKYFSENLKNLLRQLHSPNDARDTVNKIMRFEGIGKQRKREMFFNIILPFLLAYFDNTEVDLREFLFNIFSFHPPLEENSLIKKFKKELGDEKIFRELNNSAKTYFGIIYYEKEKNEAGK